MSSVNQHEIHAGSLNNLTLQIQVEKGESFYLFSSEYVQLNAIPTTNSNGLGLSQSPRRSTTPSPQKLQRLKHAKLDEWTIRLCQKIDLLEREKDANNDDSSTEEEEQDIQRNKKTLKKEENVHAIHGKDEVIAWYSLSLSHEQIQSLLDQAKVKRWDELESLIRSAWDTGSIDVLGREEDQKEDQTYTELRLQFEVSNHSTTRATSLPFASSQRIKRETPTVKEEEGSEEDSKERIISIQLNRIIDKVEEMEQASKVAIELMKAMGTLRTKAQSLERERNSSRKLIHDNRKNDRYHEPSASLVNPGRIKRKSQDDGGFEGDEEE